ncbi:MAG: Pyruvate-flavodoxin oxidoreductase [Acidimicrobiales bacterium]|nr:MAG: pyruvate:ferredoxin (flavodoxin) oxidoreductase [Actinomycetota bacterium]MBV6508212.1 Pyruvate-flavodoxin oxidoreductase [Acidimicrobiales bacterium]RIK07286.1 MAG: pyruvate:ferredoxin (flavodoxin) oxidoreductase [Acidobacteriota bacterium]
MRQRWECIDGNEATARVAHKLSEVIAIYPITPASPMGELADAWTAAGRTNLWGSVPEVVEMQSEAGASGSLHGAAQKGALATTFTASQGLLLMLPNMFKMAGELNPAVIHVAARSVATHALSIFGDHSDVMAARTAGWAMLAAGSVQEAHDFALIAHAATLRTRVPFLHFFDGFRTSHEINKIALLEDDDMRALVDEDALLEHRARGLSPDRPVLRGSAQNPDVFFQAREAVNPFYEGVPTVVEDLMEHLARRTGRRYSLVDYIGAPDPERALILMGSGTGAVDETVEAMVDQGEKVGALKLRLYRPFPSRRLAEALPSSVRAIAVLDRTKEPGAVGEPLYTDVIASLHESLREEAVSVIGGRYGLSSKEFTPSMVYALYRELAEASPRRHVTVGIVDDVTNTSIPTAEDFHVGFEGVQAVFHGLGSDGTVSANKSSVKIIGEHTDNYAQGYFVYDSKKSGAVTCSHLRFGPRPIRSTYLVEEADFIACHQFNFLEHLDVLGRAKRGATVLLNSPHDATSVWKQLPVEVQAQIIDKGLDVWVIDAYELARDLGMGARINTVMQPCFFALSGVLPRERAVVAIKESIEKNYGKRGRAVVEQNFAAVDRALEALQQVSVPSAVDGLLHRRPPVPANAPDFVQRVTARMLAGEGDLLPVSAMPVDGTFPTGTARYEKRDIAQEIPIWDPGICIDCGRCAIVCPHAAIRMKVYRPEMIEGSPASFKTKDFRSKEIDGYQLTIQVAPDDCTGCGVCVEVCPAKSKERARHKSINMEPIGAHRSVERANFDFFLGIPEIDRSLLDHQTVKGAQALQPLFEFSGACAGCGETPYLKLLTQLFGDRIVVANATGCSSIYGGNLPTTPWATNLEGRGPAWSNSLFEDNAEFGLGLRLGHEHSVAEARRLTEELSALVGDGLARALLDSPQSTEAEIAAQRERVVALKQRLSGADGVHAGPARRLRVMADDLVRKSIWIVGGDGWAYDIGYGGLDHVLGSGRDLNVLVLDTEVYSNTGGQASKATPRGAVAKFAAFGKETPRKDLGAMAMAYGNVYVAQVAMGSNDRQTVKAFLEADAWIGPSLIIAYSTCIPAHGVEASTSMARQRDAVKSGFWPLYRYRPTEGEHGHPLHLDSRQATMPIRDFALQEARWAMLARTDPRRSDELISLAQADADERWRYYSQLAGLERTVPHLEDDVGQSLDEETPE